MKNEKTRMAGKKYSPIDIDNLSSQEIDDLLKKIIARKKQREPKTKKPAEARVSKIGAYIEIEPYMPTEEFQRLLGSMITNGHIALPQIDNVLRPFRCNLVWNADTPPWDRLGPKKRWGSDDWIYLFDCLIPFSALVEVTPSFDKISELTAKFTVSPRSANYIKNKFYVYRNKCCCQQHLFWSPIVATGN